MASYRSISVFSTLSIGVIVASLGFSSASHAADQAQLERGKAATAVCVACHQADGNGRDNPQGSSWPRLAGLDAVYLANQLHAFKSGDRQNPEMRPFAMMLNEQQINDVAAWYASLPAKQPAKPDVSKETLAAGEKLALHGDWNRYIVPCIKCHGPGNQGVGHLFPDIAGQHPGYVASQLQAWREGTRKGDPQGLMLAIASRLTEDDIAAVSAWLATQPPAGDDDSASNATDETAKGASQ